MEHAYEARKLWYRKIESLRFRSRSNVYRLHFPRRNRAELNGRWPTGKAMENGELQKAVLDLTRRR